jgi:photosynthetic reaction center cytochrome c subunit
MPDLKARALGLSALTLAVVAAFIVIVSTSSAQNPPAAAAPAQTPATERPVEQAFKNIQVLKGLPESRLFPMMNFIATSLGVRCSFCHVNKDGNWDYASDEKPAKKTARNMITMTMGVNKNTFEGNSEVSCYTCHRGRTNVVHTVAFPLPTPEPRPSPAPATAGAGQPQPPRETLPTAEQVLEKYYQAIGGAAAIDKVKTRVMKGTLTTANGAAIGYELTQAGPDMVVSTVSSPDSGVIERGFNGTVAWEKSQRGLRDLGADTFAVFRRLSLYHDLKLAPQFTRMTVGKGKINDRDVYVLRVTSVEGKREQLFFDAQTGLLIRRSQTIPTPIGNIPEQIDFEDYRDVDGLKMPFTVRQSSVDASSPAVKKFTEIKLNVPVDDKRFNKPG